MPFAPLVRRCVALSALSALATSLTGPSAWAHPLDPLNADEIIGAASLLLSGGAAQPGAIFQSVELREPPKQAVLNWRSGHSPLPRQATVFWRQNKQSYKTTVNLSAGSYAPPALIPISDGQLGLTIQEVSDFSFAFSDAAFLQALARRGLRTPAQLAKVFVTPLTAGAFGLPEENKRIVKAQMYYTEGAGINLYARPIEGMQAIMDLDERKVMRVIDTGVVPIPAATHDFDEASVGALTGLRPRLKPIVVTQPQGPNFTINGSFVEWQKWRFHTRFDRRTGPVVSLVTYAGRPVLYQGLLSEIFVPYQDADPNWFYRTYMDAGEFGFGLLASPLKLGLDVPANAVLLDALVSAAIPDPSVPVVPLPLVNVVGVFERLTGSPAWRHFEQFAGGAYEGRAEVELVVRSIAQVGNYDYLLDWVFTQSGVIRAEIGLTGIDAPKAVTAAGGDPAQNTPVAPGLVAPFHSHFFNFRLDLDIDGTDNSFVQGHLHQRNVQGPRKSVWSLEEHVVADESEGRIPPEGHGRWTVINPGRRNALGQPTGYQIETHDTAEPLLKKADYERAGFIENALWVTAYDANQRYAAGDTPNQHPGAPGLPQYVRDKRSLVGRDLVVWLTLGHHHVTVAEDWPVLSRHKLGFELKPANFFDRNPALDLRRAPFEVVR